MRAYATAGGGVMFVPDEIERGSQQSVSGVPLTYADLAPEETRKSPLERLKEVAQRTAERRARLKKIREAA